jgi:6-pyruvoyltetrahydropterin/6-carboxytetrahydropterin synthase
MMYRATVDRQISAGHYNGPEGNKCRTQHGHDFQIHVEFIYGREDLDQWGWGPDFGTIKKVIDRFDHKNFNDMPEFANDPPSTENFCLVLTQALSNEVGMRPVLVTIKEGNANTIEFYPSEHPS